MTLRVMHLSTSDLLASQRQVLASGRWFAGLPSSLQHALCGNARLVTLEAGELLFQRGDDNDGLYGMVDGVVRFAAVNQAGRESVVGLAESPQWFGEVALLDGGQRTHHASLHSSRERLIRCLVTLARGNGERDASPTPALRVSQERLGSILSLSRQTVNALLQDLEREQLLVCVRGAVHILDFERLLELEASIQ